MDSEIIATLIQENEDLRKKLEEEEEISKVLSQRIQNVEQDFRKYVEKMHLYLSYFSIGERTKMAKALNDSKSNEATLKEASTEEACNEEAYNDEIGYDKPKLFRSTNEHEWAINDIVSLEI